VKTLLLSRYDRLGASSRVRCFQYIPFFESQGWEIDVSALFSDRYLQALYGGQSRVIQVLKGYCQRIQTLFKAGKYDLIWVEKEAFPFMPVLAEYLLFKAGVPYVVDYDDALFHRYDKHHRWLIRSLLGRKIDAVMKHAALVVAGNDYLAERARMAGEQRVEIVPTVVDLTQYKVRQPTNSDLLTVGWIGSPATSDYLLTLAPIFELLEKDFNVRFVAVGANKSAMEGTSIKAWPWLESSEVQSIQAFDIGIMPLIDAPWERGKCGYKLIQYMACGLPVVASPVGVNEQIVEQGVNGFLAKNLKEWEQVLRSLLIDRDLQRRMGNNGRKRVEAWYSLKVQAPRLEALISEVLR